MKNLLNFFFSFDKLFKEKLVVPFFWLAIGVLGLDYLAEALENVKLGILAKPFEFVNFFASLLLFLITIRIIAEIFVAIFRINDNLSPDKGRSELADVDPIAEARKAAELAAARTREATKTVSEKASDATKSIRENVNEMSDTIQTKAKSATASVREKADGLSGSAKQKADKTVEKVTAKDVDVKPASDVIDVDTIDVTPKPKAATTSAAKKTSSKTKPKTTAKKTATTTKKRGPKTGTKAPRDADGNLLKKDGTPRKKPGPKAK